ncbi:MAG: cation transporter [Clostridia bacterium]|nr:cation transporter [Clostridia bacterium]
MKKVWKLKNLDCANCAAKMEDGIRKINGVNSATVSFMTQRLTIECSEEKLETIIAEAEQVIRKIEPDCSILK